VSEGCVVEVASFGLWSRWCMGWAEVTGLAWLWRQMGLLLRVCHESLVAGRCGDGVLSASLCWRRDDVRLALKLVSICPLGSRVRPNGCMW
jgi:hypothetical protein